MFHKLSNYAVKPALYTPGTPNIWEDEHVSKGMLMAHLDPDHNGATRNHAFLDKSVDWICRIAPPSQYTQLLDLGCGPGLYAQRFCSAGYDVTGVDFSTRSIEYAKKQAGVNQSDIRYLHQDYLTIDYEEQFDLITLIYCDYAPFSKASRQALLRLIHRALKPQGKLIFDVFTPLMRKPESRSWYYTDEGGFWSPKAHLCLESVYQYDDEDRTELRQTLLCTSDQVRCFNVWDHFFTRESLLSELQPIGFSHYEFYGNVAGAQIDKGSETLCAVLTK